MSEIIKLTMPSLALTMNDTRILFKKTMNYQRITPDSLRILVIAPVFDKPTITSGIGAARLTEKIQNDPRQHSVIFLTSILANQWILQIVRRSFWRPDLIVYMGHGTKNAFICFYGLKLITNKTAYLMGHGPIVYAMACLAAQQLGPAIVKAGSRGFLGNERIMYAAFPNIEHTYMEDFADAWINQA